jgi:hypothetical protein
MNVNPGTHPPIRERLPFDAARIENVSETDCTVVAEGNAPGAWAEYSVESIDEPGIPEPEWVRREVVGYHFGEYRPQATPYRAEGAVALPPGCLGVELVGRDRTERLPIIF